MADGGVIIPSDRGGGLLHVITELTINSYALLKNGSTNTFFEFENDGQATEDTPALSVRL